MKFKTILGLILAAFICPVAISAQEGDTSSDREYIKLIEEGKTWEYIHEYSNYQRYTLTAFQMRFDGTETRNGVGYHKLIYCGDLTTWKAEDDRIDNNDVFWWENTPHDIVSSPNDITAYFLMRENEGKIYLYIRDLIDGDINPLDSFDFLNKYQPDEIKDEVIIYDFTKKEGETIENVLCNIGGVYSSIYPLSPATWELMDLTVKSISTVNLNGNNLILQDDLSDYPPKKYSCLESIGAITSGFLPYIDCSPVPSGHGMEYSNYNLNCLYDANGDIIYKGDNYVDVAKIIELAEVAQPTVNLAIERTGDGIRAEGAEITLYDLSGRVVASGYESLPTTSLQPGVYVAKAQSSSGFSTLKLKVD